MADDEKRFAINFSTNAKQAAGDIRELDKAQGNLEKNLEKNSGKSRSRENLSLHLQIDLLRQLRAIRLETEKTARIKEKADRQEISAGKIKIDQNKTLLGSTAKIIGAVYLGAKAVGALYNTAGEFGKYATAAGAAGFPGMRGHDIGRLEFLSRNFGGNFSTAAGNAQRLYQWMSGIQRTGGAEFEDIAQFFPGIQKTFFNSGGSLLNDPVSILTNLNRYFQDVAPSQRMSLGNMLGLSPDMVNTLSLSPNEFDSRFAEAAKKGEELFGHAEKAREAERAYHEAVTEIKSYISRMVSWFEENTGLTGAVVKVTAALGALAVALKLRNIFFPGGGGGGTAPIPPPPPGGKDKDDDDPEPPSSPDAPVTSPKAVWDHARRRANAPDSKRVDIIMAILAAIGSALALKGMRPGFSGGGGLMTMPGVNGGLMTMPGGAPVMIAPRPSGGGGGGGNLLDVNHLMMINSTQIPNLQRQIQLLRAVHGGGSVGIEAPVEININAPGGDPQAIASAVSDAGDVFAQKIAAAFSGVDIGNASFYKV